MPIYETGNQVISIKASEQQIFDVAMDDVGKLNKEQPGQKDISELSNLIDVDRDEC